MTASGVGRWWERLPSPRRIVFDQGCHKADLVSQLQAAVANESLMGGFAGLIFIHPSMEWGGPALWFLSV